VDVDLRLTRVGVAGGAPLPVSFPDPVPFASRSRSSLPPILQSFLCRQKIQPRFRNTRAFFFFFEFGQISKDSIGTQKKVQPRKTPNFDRKNVPVSLLRLNSTPI
jgi:hypothetical protein